MIFVISYDRKTGARRRFERFEDEQMAAAQQLRYELEVAASQEPNSLFEIVVLKANTEDDLMRTHSKYFGLASLKDNILNLTR